MVRDQSKPSRSEITQQLIGPGCPFEIEEVIISGRPVRTWKRCLPSIRALWEHSRAYADRDYLVYENERLSYEDAFQKSVSLAHELVTHFGIKKGDRVAIAMRNYPEWPISFWAAASIGAIVVPLNAWWQSEELAYGLDDSGSSLLIADEARAELVAPALAARPSLREILVARPHSALPPGCQPYPEASLSPEAALPPVILGPEDEATLFYTSGTTGRPKGALGTHRNLCNNVVSSEFANAYKKLRQGLALDTPNKSTDPPPPFHALISVPFFHVTGCHGTLATHTAGGNKLVMMHKWDPERALDLIECEKINGFGGVPSMVWQVLESPSFKTRDTSSLTTVSYGGAPAAPELVRRIVDEFGEHSASQGYGMTETSSMTTVITGEDYEKNPDSIGPPVPVCEVKVVDQEGRTLSPGETGELCIYGPNLVKRYWNKPEATAETFVDGWCHSGDIAKIDEEGLVFLVDRAKDMVIRGGENIYCVEVENMLFSHPDVMDAAVVGIPERILGEEVGAAVQIRPGKQLSEAILRQYMKNHLAAYKVPIRILIGRDPLPRNANGKILKTEIKRRLADPV